MIAYQQPTIGTNVGRSEGYENKEICLVCGHRNARIVLLASGEFLLA